MELRHLRYFVAVAEELHFGRAAERLHIAQPPLSQQIRRLEQELGSRLFHRTNRRVQLTDAGRAFLVEARATLVQAERARDIVSRTARGEVGQLIIGHMAAAEISVFPRLLPVFRRRHPGIDLVFQLVGESEQLEMLRDGRIHAGFMRRPATDPTLTVKPILREPVVVVLPERHPLARRRTVAVSTLADECFIFFPRRFAPALYEALTNVFRDAGIAPKIVHDTNRLHTALSLVSTGRGLLLSGKCVEKLRRPGIVCRPLRPRVPDLEMAIVYDPKNPSRLLRALVAVVDDVFPATRS